MSEIKNVGYTWMAKCNQLTSLPFKALTYGTTLYVVYTMYIERSSASNASSVLASQSTKERSGGAADTA